MAEENGLDSGSRSRNPPGDPAANQSKGRSAPSPHHRASIGSIQARDSLLRNSTGSSVSADTSKKKAVPHYLRASTGSCHDLCKYGREHSFEKKERKPLRKRVPTEPSIEILLSDKQKMGKPSTDAKSSSLDLKPSRDTKSYTPKQTSSLDRGKEAMKQKPSKDIKNYSLDAPSAKSYVRSTKMLPDVKPLPRKENGSSGSKTLTSKKPTKRIPSADPPEIVKGVIFPSTEVEDSVKRATSTDKKLSKKTTLVSQPRSSTLKSKPVSAYSGSSDGTRGKGITTDTAKTGKNVASSKALIIKLPVKKVLNAPAATLSPKLSVSKLARSNSGKAGNLKLVSSVKDRKKPERVVKAQKSNDEKVLEKTLHVIEMETKNDVSESTPGVESITPPPSLSSAESFSFADSSSLSSHDDDNAQTEQSSGEADADNAETEQSSVEADEVEAPPVKENHNKTARKSREVVSEDKCRKLKFRSGKVVDVQLDTNSPRRLRFRRGRILGAQDSKGDTRKALKKAAAKDVTKGAEVSSEKVVLKHQDVQDKKDAVGLFNNVIEETASKLVETRKSKVKALVGAFETVISLQETKPTSPTRSSGQ